MFTSYKSKLLTFTPTFILYTEKTFTIYITNLTDLYKTI